MTAIMRWGAVWVLTAVMSARAGGESFMIVRVTSVLSGDSFSYYGPTNLDLRVRLAGIAAPEREQPHSARARQELSRKILGQDVKIEISRRAADGTVFGQVRLGERWINREMLAAGWGWAVEADAVPDLVAAAAAARAVRLGIWQDPDPLPPWEWRRQQALPQPAQDSDTVHITSAGRLYHRTDCPRLKERTSTLLTRVQAEKLGYQPCGRCRP